MEEDSVVQEGHANEMHGEHEHEAHTFVTDVSNLPKGFLEELNSLPSVEARLEKTVELMQRVLEGGVGLHFGHFWGARKLCIDFFKQTVEPNLRVKLWARYSDLCREAKRLKEMFDEQSSFITEQIEKAIFSVEEELAQLPSKLGTPPQIEALSGCQSLQEHISSYLVLQHELSFLNAFASRVTALRKELVKTEIRAKQKNRLFQHLSVLGDAIYPRRKQAMHEVSELFLTDVDRFIQSTFVGDLKTFQLFAIKEEIKRLQGAAKILTLTTDVFTKVRLQLSTCWDSVQNVVGERKKAQNEQRNLFRKHKDEALQSIADIEKAFKEGLSSHEAAKRLQDFRLHLRTLQLSHQDVRMLKEQCAALEALFEEKKVVSQSAEIVHDGKKLLRKFEACLAMASFEEQEEELERLLREKSLTTYSRGELLELDELGVAIRVSIQGKLEERASTISKGDVDSLQRILISFEHLRSESKQQLEMWRKASSESGVDFTLAMRYIELIEAERARLGRVEKRMSELEERLESWHDASNA
jgi:hypothetical protein